VSNLPSTQVSCLKAIALAPLAFPSPLHPLPAYRAFISIYKDYNNKPDSSVRCDKKKEERSQRRTEGSRK
jgi:hypothetical protein